MNDTAALKRTSEIVLANELPFTLAGSHVRPAALEVEHEGIRSSLEPRVMQVLVSLHRGAGQPVSRDTLIAQCWGGRVVTEGALNRCVAQLRKALAANAAIRVETIPKVGYRLRLDEPAALAAPAEPAPVAVSEIASDPAPGPTPSRKLPIIWIALTALAVLALAVWALFRPQPVVWAAASYRPLTTDPGNEVFPALSPDGDQLVYAGRPNPFAPSELYLRNVDQGTPLQLTNNEEDDYNAAWSPRADRIAFVRSPPEGPCSILVTPIPQGPQQVVTRCQALPYTRVSWLDDSTLVFADAPSEGELPRIRTVEIQSGIVRDLTSPPRESLGDTDPTVSPNGRYVVFRRSLIPGADDLVVLDLNTSKERALSNDGWKASGYAWSGDSRHIFFSSNRGGETALWSVDTRINAPPRQVSLGLGTLNFSRMSADRRNRLAIEITRDNTNLARVTHDGTIQPVTMGSGTEWESAVAKDGTIAYISSRTGSYQLWIMRPDGETVRLTALLASYLASPSWSPDGKTVAFVAVSGRRADIYTIGRDESPLRQLTQDGVGKRYPVYSPSGDRLFYVAREQGKWRLMALPLEPGAKPQPVPGGEDWHVVHADFAGNLYGQRGGSIVTLDSASPLMNISLSYADVWHVGERGIYIRRGRAPTRPSSLWLYPWNGPEQKLADVPYATSSISVDRDETVLFSHAPEYQVDVGMLELRTP